MVKGHERKVEINAEWVAVVAPHIVTPSPRNPSGSPSALSGLPWQPPSRFSILDLNKSLVCVMSYRIAKSMLITRCPVCVYLRRSQPLTALSWGRHVVVSYRLLLFCRLLVLARILCFVLPSRSCSRDILSHTGAFATPSVARSPPTVRQPRGHADPSLALKTAHVAACVPSQVSVALCSGGGERKDERGGEPRRRACVADVRREDVLCERRANRKAEK